MIKSRGIKWLLAVAFCGGGRIGLYRVLVGKTNERNHSVDGD